jgi:hypothetical protein
MHFTGVHFSSVVFYCCTVLLPPETERTAMFLLAAVNWLILNKDKQNQDGIFTFIQRCVYFNTAHFKGWRKVHFYVVILFNLEVSFSSLVPINNFNLTRFTDLVERFNANELLSGRICTNNTVYNVKSTQ